MTTSTDARDDWAWLHIEAMADDTLASAEHARMLAATAADPQLRAAVARARTLKGELRRLPRARPPRGLLRRLLAVPGVPGRVAAPARAPLAWPALAASFGTVAVAAIAALIVVALRQVPSDPDPDPEAAAMREFAVAMTYLHRSAVVTRDEVGDQVGLRLASVFTASRDSLAEVDLSRQ